VVCVRAVCINLFGVLEHKYVLGTWAHYVINMFILFFTPGMIIDIIFCNIHHSKGIGKGKGKATPILAWTGPEGSRRLRLPEGLDSGHLKVARLLVLTAFTSP